jgi:hypothetical protein
MTILSGLVIGCWNDKVTEKKLHNTSSTPAATPKNYLDFKYSKAIAFATVDPFDYSELYFSKDMDLSKFHDTISITLDSSQTAYLNGLLSGRYRKPSPQDDAERTIADCFYPRHNIIFTDKRDNILNYISVCFECGNVKQSKSYLADMDNMRSFFNSIGLKVFDRPDHYEQYYNSLRKRK